MTTTLDTPTLPVLDVACGDCHGTGVIASYAWTRWLHTYATARADFEAVHPDEDWYRSPEQADLDNEQPDEPYDFDCHECGGTGREPTDAGRMLLAFLREHTGVAG
ncbi:MAG TPA: hypothetical protein VIP77_15450 [Jiangellaceae bacterium]